MIRCAFWLTATHSGRRWLALLALSSSCEAISPPFASNAETKRGAAADARLTANPEPIEPIPLEVHVDAKLAELGEALFESTIISTDGRVSCSSCHEAGHGLADRLPVSQVPFRPKQATNSTSLFNIRYFCRITWSGKFESLDAHFDALIKNPKIMGSSWENITDRISTDPSWAPRFLAVFRDGVSEANVRAALLEYERSLVTPNAPFDRWLRGDAGALSPEARQGYARFKDYGCVGCHQGMAVGANLFQRFGTMRDYFQGGVAPSGAPEREADLGRFNVTHRESFSRPRPSAATCARG